LTLLQLPNAELLFSYQKYDKWYRNLIGGFGKVCLIFFL